MKKFFIFSLLAIIISFSANAQGKYVNSVYYKTENKTQSKVFNYLEFTDLGFVKTEFNMGYNFGACRYYKHGYMGMCCGGEVYNISVEVAIAGEVKGENRYGSGGVSDDYRMMSVMLGYVSYLRCSNQMLLIINPKVGVCTESQLYNDKYYGSDVAKSVGIPEIGVDIGLWINYFLLKIGVTNMKANAQIGFSMLF